MTKKIGLGILLAMMATAASARTDSSCTQPTPPTTIVDFILSLFNGPSNCSGGGSTGGGGDVKHVNAPEIDPSSAMAGLTLMSAGLVVLRGRRKSK